MDKLKSSIASFLYKAGLSANAATGVGLFLAAAAGWLAYRGEFFWAGGFLLLSGLFDLLDGAIARASGKTGPFGGILDSCLDRYGDFFVLAGIVLFCSARRYDTQMLLALSALMGSFEISYVRARAECAVARCKVGFWERGERIVYLSMGLLLNNLPLVLLVLGIGTHLTALVRMGEARRQAAGGSAEMPAGGWARNILVHSGPRTSRWYLAKTVVWFLLAVLVRRPFVPLG